jgi:hypothetical protein
MSDQLGRLDSSLARARDLLGVDHQSQWWYRLGVAAVVTLVTWPIRPDLIEVGVDPSYRAGLALARERGFDFGSEVVFNYGPLGFLGGEPFDRGAGVVSWGVQLGVALAMSYVLVGLLNRVLRPWIAGAVAVSLLLVVFGGVVVPMATSLVIIALLWSLSSVADSDGDRWGPSTAAVIGFLIGLAVLVKVDSGLICAAVVLTALTVGSGTTLGWRCAVRNVSVAALSAAATSLLFFVLLGSPFGDFGPWLGGSAEIVRGFSAALGLSRSAPLSIWELAGAVVVALAFVAAVAVSTPRPRAQRLGAAAVAAVGLYLTFRQGFVRHDVFHVTATYAALALVPVTMCAVWPFRRVVVFSAAAVVVFLPGQRPSPDLVVAPVESLRAAASTAASVVSPARFESMIERRREAVRDRYQVPATMLDRIGDGSVAIVPEGLEIAFGYPRLHWAPLPVLQEYQAYTPSLDQRNADFLASDAGPEWVMREVGQAAVDDHFPRFTSPEANLALICHYEVVQQAKRVELLQRTGNRCGDPRPIGSSPIVSGRSIAVPVPSGDELVIARFSGVGDGPIDGIASTLFRGRAFTVDLDSGSYRFVPGTQTGWHVVSAPPCVEMAASGPSVESLSIEAVVGSLPGESPMSAEFAVVPIRCDQVGR